MSYQIPPEMAGPTEMTADFEPMLAAEAGRDGHNLLYTLVNLGSEAEGWVVEIPLLSPLSISSRGGLAVWDIERATASAMCGMRVGTNFDRQFNCLRRL